LHAWIQERIASVAEGRTTPDQYLVAGSRALLQALQAEGLILVLASGTDDDDVQAEARLLGVADYFDEIRGAIDHSRDNPKVAVIEAMMAKWGQHLAFRAVIGDGPVEIEIGRRYQALTIGVASDERVAGCRDPEKEARLHQAGAQWIVDDLSDVEAIMGHIRRAAVP
jgi:phosphoglycolate phosphatase-like HAD superfamily hydrolase